MTTPQPVSVVVADDQPLLRAALRALISNMPGFDVLAEAADGAEAVAAARASRPDVVLMDIRMPGTDGLRPPGRSPATPPAPTCGCSS
jgi:DNA-binding NarL/FixJ family response regulator